MCTEAQVNSILGMARCQNHRQHNSFKFTNMTKSTEIRRHFTWGGNSQFPWKFSQGLQSGIEYTWSGPWAVWMRPWVLSVKDSPLNSDLTVPYKENLNFLNTANSYEIPMETCIQTILVNILPTLNHGWSILTVILNGFWFRYSGPSQS